MFSKIQNLEKIDTSMSIHLNNLYLNFGFNKTSWLCFYIGRYISLLAVALDCHTCAPCELGEKGVNTTCPEMLNGYCQKTILAGIVTKNCMSKSPGLTNGCHGKDSDHQVCLCDNVDLCNSSESLHKQWVVLSVIIAAIAAKIFNWKPKGAMETLDIGFASADLTTIEMKL